MGKIPRITAKEAEKLLLKSGFEIVRSKGSHRIYVKGDKRIIVPFHKGRILHPKLTKQVLKIISSD